MAETPLRTVRVPVPLESAARRGAPELAALDFATLARVGLAVLAGMAVPEAIKAVRTRPGPKRREDAAA
jgi:hypothetical protein